ncbi:MAG: pyridoxal phosphate-dependent aminotransferase [Leptospiraceae bacterium]|nr:pyridoxal phosphate-dependent aminotransferase [Leptospiraceae bacterium]MDW7976320.1 pyridoxal phosphate-dependent aminotransferase [Leptospiraceae bacterium]
MNFLAKRMQNITPSLTLAITAKARELQSMGKDVIGFGAGEPDFDTPVNIKNSAIKAIQEGFTKYTAVGGIPELKKAIIQKYEKEFKLNYSMKEVVVSVGGKQALYNLFFAILNPGDEVIIFSPYWVSYIDIVQFAEGKPVIITTKHEDEFLPKVEDIKNAITPKTKAIIINSPSNPTGSYYHKELLEEIVKLLKLHPHILIVSDDIYEKLLYDGLKFDNVLTVDPSLKDRTIIINGVSKTYSMTGWRIGYALGPAEIIEAMDTIQGQSTSNPTSIAQKASVEALTGDQSFIETFKKIFSERRDLMYRILKSINKIKVFKPKGAFYIFPDISEIYSYDSFQKQKLPNESNSMAFSRLLLEHHNVAVVPGIAFGDDNCIRLSYALSEENIRKGLERLGNFIHDLIH